MGRKRTIVAHKRLNMALQKEALSINEARLSLLKFVIKTKFYLNNFSESLKSYKKRHFDEGFYSLSIYMMPIDKFPIKIPPNSLVESRQVSD